MYNPIIHVGLLEIYQLGTPIVMNTFYLQFSLFILFFCCKFEDRRLDGRTVER